MKRFTGYLLGAVFTGVLVAGGLTQEQPSTTAHRGSTVATPAHAAPLRVQHVLAEGVAHVVFVRLTYRVAIFPFALDLVIAIPGTHS